MYATLLHNQKFTHCDVVAGENDEHTNRDSTQVKRLGEARREWNSRTLSQIGHSEDDGGYETDLFVPRDSETDSKADSDPEDDDLWVL